MVDKRKAKKNFKELKDCAKAIVDFSEEAEAMYLDEDYHGAVFNLDGISEELEALEDLVDKLCGEVEERIERIKEV